MGMMKEFFADIIEQEMNEPQWSIIDRMIEEYNNESLMSEINKEIEDTNKCKLSSKEIVN